MTTIAQSSHTPEPLPVRRLPGLASALADGLILSRQQTCTFGGSSAVADTVATGRHPAGSPPATDPNIARQLAKAPDRQPSGTAKPPAKPMPMHLTELYGMDGSHLDSIATTSRFTRVMVDEATYTAYLQAKFAAAYDPDVTEQATQFVDGLVETLSKEEKATKKDMVAFEQKWVLSFDGAATDKTLSRKTRQLGEGYLSVNAVFDNGRQATVESFDAISGPMNNGLIPNGLYKAYAPIDAVNQFPDETGKFGFKMVLNPTEGMKRGDFRIHSVQSRARKGAWMTEGCVGLTGGHSENVRFHELMTGYFRNHKSIDLKVAINQNANVKVQLGDRETYTDAAAPAKQP